MFCLDPDLGIHSNYLDIKKQENVKQGQNVVKYFLGECENSRRR